MAISSTAQQGGIIVADSEVIIRHVLSDYLRRCGYTVIDAASSDEVVAILTESAAPISVILADADLGGSMNAFALRFWVRQKRTDIVVILAGNVEAAAKSAGELCEEGPHLKRPYDTQLVLNHIKQMLGTARK